MSERAKPIKSLPPTKRSTRISSPPDWHADFLKMLPKIADHASFSFRHLNGDSRDEMIQEVVANACTAYARLVEQGRADAATWSSLARFAIRQVRDGRKVGSGLNIRDVCSHHCQIRKGVHVQNLSRWDEQEQEWTEMVIEDRHATPADVAAFRVDFRQFLKSLSRRNRKLALQLAKGHATSWVACQFKISAGRVSQLRRKLFEDWQRFHGEPVPV